MPFEAKGADMNIEPLRHHLSLRRCVALAAAAAMLGMAGGAAAVQYQWRDDRGRMVFSDQPPPASVAPVRIIKAPASAQSAPAATDAVPAAAGTGAGSTAAAPVAAAKAGNGAGNGAGVSEVSPAESIADRELAFRKRMAERAEQEKKAAEAAERDTKLAKACDDARGDIRSLESGQRISRINAAGEREFLSEAERAQRLKNARVNVSERC